MKNTKDFMSVNAAVKVVLFSAMILTSIASISIVKAQGINQKNEESSIKLDTTSHKVINISYDKPEIKPGESKIEREAREAAEAKAKAEAAKRNTVSRERRITYTDPSDFVAVYKRAGEAYGVDWRILNAIHKVETGYSGSSYIANPSGATGPMQFLPSTFRRHGVDGNGDGVKDIGNVEDAIFSAAAYLKACGYPNVQKALWGYNPSTSYYNKVMSIVNGL